MSMAPDDPRLIGLPEEDLATMMPNLGRGETVDPALQPFVDDPYLAYNRFKYGTVDGTISGPTISGAPNPNVPTTLTTTSTTTTTTTTGFQPQKDARNTIRGVLARYGLESLGDFLYDVYARQEVDITNPDAMIYAIRDQDIYKKRFAANTARAAKNLPELDPASYLALEDDYRRLMQSNGLPLGFYDQTEDFTRLLEGDVSVSELQDRIQNGFRAVQDADPEVKRQMQELYGVNEAGLAAYFLDPERAAPILTRQAKAAQVSARAREQAGFQLTASSAEDLIARGYTPDEAQQAFTKAGQLAGLYTEMGSEEALTEAQKIGAAFGYDVAATHALEQRKRARLGEFQGGGGFARTTGATSGTVETGVGTAQ